MKAKEIRDLTTSEIEEQIKSSKEELFNLRFQLATGQLEERVKYSKKYKTHDENNSAKLGDIVKIQETRPLSATKRFRLVEIVEESVII